MSNRSKQPNPQAAQALSKFLGALGEAAKKRQEQQAQQAQQLPAQPVDDLNILPLPKTQRVTDEGMIWTWEPILDEVLVHGILPKSGDDYRVELFVNSDNKNVKGHSIFHGEDAKRIGQALISAWNYQNVWKQHAGEFIERELMAPKLAPPEPFPDNGSTAENVTPLNPPAKRAPRKRTPRKR